MAIYAAHVVWPQLTHQLHSWQYLYGHLATGEDITKSAIQVCESIFLLELFHMGFPLHHHPWLCRPSWLWFFPQNLVAICSLKTKVPQHGDKYLMFLRTTKNIQRVQPFRMAKNERKHLSKTPKAITQFLCYIWKNNLAILRAKKIKSLFQVVLTCNVHPVCIKRRGETGHWNSSPLCCPGEKRD